MLTHTLTDTDTDTHTHTLRLTHTVVLTPACLSLPHTHYLHQFWWPQDDGAPPSPCIKPKPALLSERSRKFVTSGEKGPSDDNKA